MERSRTPVLNPPETEKLHEEPTRVLVKNDSVNEFGHVVDTFCHVLAWSLERSWQVAVHIHEQGEDVVFEGHYERAELIYEQLKAATLDAHLI